MVVLQARRAGGWPGESSDTSLRLCGSVSMRCQGTSCCLPMTSRTLTPPPHARREASAFARLVQKAPAAQPHLHGVMWGRAHDVRVHDVASRHEGTLIPTYHTKSKPVPVVSTTQPRLPEGSCGSVPKRCQGASCSLPLFEKPVTSTAQPHLHWVMWRRAHVVRVHHAALNATGTLTSCTA